MSDPGKLPCPIGGLVHDATGFRYNRYFLGVVPPDPASFFKFEAWLGARVFY